MAFLLTHLVDRAAQRVPDNDAACFGDASLSWAELSEAWGRVGSA